MKFKCDKCGGDMKSPAAMVGDGVSGLKAVCESCYRKMLPPPVERVKRPGVKGAGRKPLPPEKKRYMVSVRMPPRMWFTFRAWAEEHRMTVTAAMEHAAVKLMEGAAKA